MADRCIWCDLDGRTCCPVHYRRDPLLVGIVALVFVVLAAAVVIGAIR